MISALTINVSILVSEFSVHSYPSQPTFQLCRSFIRLTGKLYANYLFTAKINMLFDDVSTSSLRSFSGHIPVAVFSK